MLCGLITRTRPAWQRSVWIVCAAIYQMEGMALRSASEVSASRVRCVLGLRRGDEMSRGFYETTTGDTVVTGYRARSPHDDGGTQRTETRRPPSGTTLDYSTATLYRWLRRAMRAGAGGEMLDRPFPRQHGRRSERSTCSYERRGCWRSSRSSDRPAHASVGAAGDRRAPPIDLLMRA